MFPSKLNNLPIDVVNNVYKEICHENAHKGYEWKEEYIMVNLKFFFLTLDL